MKWRIGLNSVEAGIFLTSLFLLVMTSKAQFGFGCSSRGCSNHGTFAFATPLPPRPGVKWSWRQNSTDQNYLQKQALGCSSSMSIVLCPTSHGYIGLTPASGQAMWQSADMTSTYLPSVDFYGNAWLSSTHQFLKVTNDGSKQLPSVKTDQFQSQFGAIKSDFFTTLILSSRTDTPQVVAYSNDHVRTPTSVLYLKDNVSNISGTFVPNSDPLINSSRAYICTRFVPDTLTITNEKQLSSMYRLYAIDLPQDMNDTMRIAWSVDVPETKYYHPLTRPNQEGISPSEFPNPGLVFFNNTVYINYQIPTRTPSPLHQVPPPPPYRVCAVRDLDNQPRIVFTAQTMIGAMAIYDLTETPFSNITSGRRTLWMAYGPVVYGYDLGTGSLIKCIELAQLAPNMPCHITSKLSVSRQLEHPDRDVLVFGVQDSKRHAHVMAVEVDASLNPRVLWSVNMTSVRPDTPTDTEWLPTGQLASVTQFTGSEYRFGVVVSVVEIYPKLKSSRLTINLVM